MNSTELGRIAEDIVSELAEHGCNIRSYKVKGENEKLDYDISVKVKAINYDGKFEHPYLVKTSSNNIDDTIILKFIVYDKETTEFNIKIKELSKISNTIAKELKKLGHKVYSSIVYGPGKEDVSDCDFIISVVDYSGTYRHEYLVDRVEKGDGISQLKFIVDDKETKDKPNVGVANDGEPLYTETELNQKLKYEIDMSHACGIGTVNKYLKRLATKFFMDCKDEEAIQLRNLIEEFDNKVIKLRASAKEPYNGQKLITHKEPPTILHKSITIEMNEDGSANITEKDSDTEYENEYGYEYQCPGSIQ